MCIKILNHEFIPHTCQTYIFESRDKKFLAQIAENLAVKFECHFFETMFSKHDFTSTPVMATLLRAKVHCFLYRYQRTPMILKQFFFKGKIHTNDDGNISQYRHQVLTMHLVWLFPSLHCKTCWLHVIINDCSALFLHSRIE